MKLNLMFAIAAIVCCVQAIPVQKSILERLEELERTVSNLVSSTGQGHALERNKRGRTF